MKRSWHSSQHSGSSEPERYHLKDIIDGSEIFKEMEDGHQQLLVQLQAFVNKRVPWKLWTIGEVVDMWHKVINNKPIDYVVHKYAGGKGTFFIDQGSNFSLVHLMLKENLGDLFLHIISLQNVQEPTFLLAMVATIELFFLITRKLVNAIFHNLFNLCLL